MKRYFEGRPYVVQFTILYKKYRKKYAINTVLKFLSLITRPTLFKKTINIEHSQNLYKKISSEIFMRMLKENTKILTIQNL